MGSTLYLLRQQPDRLSPSLFRVSDADMDIVFIEQSTSITSSMVGGVVVPSDGITVNGSRPTLTYDDLVEKIFSSEHVIVL